MAIDDEPIMSDIEFNAVTETEEIVLSHKQQRKFKRKRERGEVEDSNKKPKKSKKEKEKVEPEISSTKRENSVWVGNLAYKTTQDDLRTFFDGTGEITRINMPKGPIKGSAVKRENSGYAYIDFATEDAKLVAISLSERNLHGRRLLIKDGSNFEGSKSAAAVLAKATNGKAVSLTKSSRRILASQKESPCPVLFMGNLGYEATKEQIREMLLHHVQVKGRKATGPHSSKLPDATTISPENDASDDEGSQTEGDDSSPSTEKKSKPAPAPLLSFETITTDLTSKPRKPREPKKPEDNAPSAASELGLRKIRLFTFPDTGKCKGFCFLDFESTAHATAALIHPGNHRWNNRDLILQYASLDAVRRGGYPEADGKRVFVKGSQRTAVSLEGALAVAETGEIRPSDEAGLAEEMDRERLGGWQARENGQVSTKPQSAMRRGPTGGRVKQDRPRPKPGAALAAAQRATAGIVPGQGTKVKFT